MKVGIALSAGKLGNMDNQAGQEKESDSKKTLSQVWVCNKKSWDTS